MAKKKKKEVETGRILGRLNDDGSITPFIQKQQEEDIAPVRNDNKWFKNGIDTSGYDIQNPLDAINRFNASVLMTGVDIIGQVGLGVTKPIEGVGDFAQNRVADVLDFFGGDKTAEKIRKSAAKEWGVNRELEQSLARDNDRGIDDMSFLGTKGKSIPQGVGSVLLAMGSGGLGGAIGGTNAAASVASLGIMGVGSAGNAEQEALEQGATRGEARLYGILSGASETLSEMMFGGLSKGSQVLGIGTGLFDSADDAIINSLTKKINNRLVKTFTQAGLKATSEGIEEVVSGLGSAWAKKLTYMKGEDIKKLIEDENLLDSFLSGTLSAAVSQAPNVAQNITTRQDGKLRLQSNNEIRDFITNLNEQEQQVVEREIENRLGQEEKVTKKRRIEIEKQVIEDLDRGYINANTIRDVLGENYNAERDVRLNESFNEETRRTQAYENDLSKYDEKQRKTIQTAIDSGLLNNSNKTHDFVDLIAKLSADKGIDFDFTNNERIKESGFAIDGKQVNGFIKDGKIALNLESNQALNKTVGHEITHVLEGTDLYDSLQDSLKSFIGEREWNNRISELEKTYKGVKGANIENELTSDLVGEYVFNDEKFVKSLSTKNPNLFQKIFDEIKYMVKIATAGSKEARDLEKVKRAFEKAYRETSKTQEGTQYSIKDNNNRELSKEQQTYFKDSKIRNENGELEVVYHTSPNQFTVFDSERTGENTGYDNTAFGSFVTTNRNFSERFGDINEEGTKGNTMEMYANITNPITHPYNAEYKYSGEQLDNIVENWFNAIDETEALEELKSYVEDGEYDSLYQAYRNTVEFSDESPFEYASDEKKKLQEKGYDGVEFVEGLDKDVNYNVSDSNEPVSSYAVFDSNQLKNIDNLNPTSNPDIRYSLTDDKGRTLSENQQIYFNESVVRDKDGNLKTYYNGSDNFNIFNKNFMSDSSKWGKGIYLTEYEDIAKNYGADLKESYVNITNPLYDNKKTITFEQYNDLYQRLYDGEQAYREEYDMYNNDLDLLWDITNKGSWADYAQDIKETTGKDGIIINRMDQVEDMIIAFQSNQVKRVTNLNPTDDADIRYQLGNNDIAPTRGWNVRGEDIRLQNTVQETIAPLQEQVQQLTDTITRLEDRIAPLNEQEADELYQETQRGFENEAAPIRENLTPEENQRMDMLELLERNNMMNDERRYEKEQLENKINPVYPTEEATPGQALSDIRDAKEIGSPKIKAYQYEHPEVKPYFQEEARRMLSELNNSTSGSRYVTERTNSMYGDWHGIKRFTSPEIAALLDGEYGTKYQKEDIRKGLNAIIEDHGAENIAVAKRIELVLDERLRNGYDAWGVLDENGEQYHVAPNSEYLNMLAEQEWQNYFDDINSQYPLDVNQVQYALEQERQQEEQYRIEKSLEEMTEDDINLEPFLSGLQGASERQAERQQLREELNQKKEIKIPKQSDSRRAVNRGLGLLVNEFAVLDDYSKQTGNKDIKFKTDTYNNYQAIAQSNIETAQTDINGKAIGRSGSSIFEEAKKLGLENTFDEYLKQWANVDRAKQGKGVANYSAKESYKIVKEMEAKYPALKRLGNDMWQYYRNARHNLRDAGIINQDVSDMLGRMYPHYTPYISENIENYFTDEGKLKPKATIKRAKGGAAIGSLLSAEEAMQRYTKSEFNTIFGNDLFKEIVKTSNDIVQLGGDDRGMQFVNADNLYADKDGYYLTAYENGEPITARINEDMYRTLTRESRNRISDIENTFSAVTKPLQGLSKLRRNILTSWSPTFIAKNFIKDFQEGIFNSKYTKDFIKNYPTAFKELATNTELAQQFKSLYGSGLTMGQYDIDANNYNPSGKNRNFLKGIKNANELIELAPRYAEFKASIDHGASIQEAMYNAREVTTNFSRGGTLAKALNRNGFTFLNSSIQGFDKFIRNFSGENGAKGIVNSLAKAAIFGIAPAVFNELAFGSGDDKDEEYEALPDYIKDNYYIIKTGDGNFIRIPKGRVLSVFGSAARRTIEAMEGEENAFEGFLNNAWTQVGFNNPDENNIFAPLMQAYGTENGTNWYDKNQPIVPTRLQDKPKAEQYDAGTDAFSIWLGDKLGISPYKLNYVLDQYSGGIGDIFLPMITEEANSDGSIIAPIKDQFTADSTTDNKYVSDFYSKNDELTVNANSSKATDEDILKQKYMSTVSFDMGQLYKERREVQADKTLSKQEKYQKAQAIKDEINRMAKEALDNYENVNITGDYANINGMEYQKTDDGWKKVNSNNADTMNSLGLSDREKNNYTKTKQNISSIKEKYKDTDDYNGKKSEIIGEIINTNLDDNSKLSLYQDTYRDKLADSIDDLGINADTYLEYKAQDFSADKDKNGKSISGSKKRKVFDYINSMDVPYEQKLILAKSEYNSFNDNNAEIIEYIENTGMDYDERIELYKALGFKVDGDSISW